MHDEDDHGVYGDAGYIYTRFSGDIMDYYISGDVAPSGRFKYSYISTYENATGKSAPETQAETETAAVSEILTENDTYAETGSDEYGTQTVTTRGCSSTIVSSAVVVMIAAAVALRKKTHLV